MGLSHDGVTNAQDKMGGAPENNVNRNSEHTRSTHKSIVSGSNSVDGSGVTLTFRNNKRDYRVYVNIAQARELRALESSVNKNSAQENSAHRSSV